MSQGIIVFMYCVVINHGNHISYGICCCAVLFSSFSAPFGIFSAFRAKNKVCRVETIDFLDSIDLNFKDSRNEFLRADQNIIT